MPKRSKKTIHEPKTYLTINKKIYRAINPQKALAVAKRLKTGEGLYKVHVIYGQHNISKRKKETIDNLGSYTTAKEAKRAIYAFLDKHLWIE
jgi:hypothetical protein